MRLRNCAYVITFHIKKRQKNIKNLLLEEIYYNQGIDSIFEFIKKNLLILICLLFLSLLKLIYFNSK